MNTFIGRWTVAGLLIAAWLVPVSASANSKFLNVQGKLTDTSGNPLTGTQTVTFRLYTSSTAPVALAISTETDGVVFSTGLFNVALGSSTSLDSLSFNQVYWLGIQVAGDANELAPRQQLGASAYAQGSVGDFNVGGSLIVVNSMTSPQASLNKLVASTITTSGNVTVGGQAVVGGQAIVGGSMTVQGGGLSVAGQAIIVGTMTVQGSAFSVGGATFSLAGTTLTLNTAALAVSALGVQWADGSVSTTGAFGNVVNTTSTNTFTAPNTFTSTVTVGVTNWNSSTASYTAELAQVFSVSAGTLPAGSSQIWFYDLRAGYRYRIDVRFRNTTNSDIYLRFNNGDSGSNYDTEQTCERYSGPLNYAASPTNQIFLDESHYGINNGDWIVGIIEFEIPADAPSRAIVYYYLTDGQGSAGYDWSCVGGGDYYSGGSNVVNLTLLKTAGTWNGKFVLSHKRWSN